MKITIEGREDPDSGDREPAIVLAGVHDRDASLLGLSLSFETGDGLQFAYIKPDRWRDLVEAGNLILGEGA